MKKPNLNEDFPEIVICYPNPERNTCKERLKQLEKLGVERILSEGRVQLGKFKVLGKGCTSVVVKALYRGRKVVLKIRRTDSDRKDLLREAMILKEVNKYGIGPKLLDYTKDILVMEHIDGISIGEWIMQVEDQHFFKEVLKKLLDMLFLMDTLGICHLELARPKNHIIVSGNRPVILDFETISTKTKKSNLTQVLAFLLYRDSAITGKVLKLLKIKDLERLKMLLRKYKKNRCKNTYLDILKAMNLA
ncbi:MAG: hypothetical protein DRJ44_00945 [Thermoprotei archaeon]|nr:MAG: hypothetical protein DRJ44_00945 [Thermoprotei archaeon]